MKNSMLPVSIAMALGMAASNAFAHGYMDSPKARQAICEAQGGFWWPKDGSNIPNKACRAAYLNSGHVQFVQQHEFAANVPDYFNQQAVQAAIPDGQLCGGGDRNKAGMNIASSDWQKTLVTPDSQNQIKVRFRATTPHNPSFWQFYLTKPEADFESKPLAWSDLELIQEHGNLDFFVAPDGKRYYEMQIAIPSKFSGDAILYTRWQRDDVVGEGFYNCSDITIVRDTTPTEPVNWTAAGFFVKPGQQANPGDTVWLRVFDANGQELVQEKLLITKGNVTSWVKEFANTLSSNYANTLRIGVAQSDGNIVFDAVQLASNQLFVSDTQHTFNLSVLAKPQNRAPVVHTPADLTLKENSSTSLHVHAFDDDRDPLTFRWQLPSPLSYSGSGATITLTAPEVQQNTDYQGQVTVSDGRFEKTVSFTITVTNQTAPPSGDTWRADRVYTAGDTAVYQGKSYRAKWWVKGQQPDQSDAWELLDKSDASNEWNANKAYTGGDRVSYQGVEYQARWWTKGQHPSKHSVWKQL
ncbi:lytic polysaccharide monooxygenase [Pseudoalteromonas piscicida]|uniref:lytic polysaccharide monooxygenase n=1 Tax=Pseudoalteromonas piscicida TaxID=43662 RepID=UPI0030A7254F